MFLSIGAAAMLIGVSVVTLRRWDSSGELLPNHRTLGGHRRYLKEVLEAKFLQKQAASEAKPAIAYARVSSRDQVRDLEIQKQKLRQYCEGMFARYEMIEDLGSGLNFKKPGLRKLLKLIHQGSMSHLVLNHKDRLLRFGAELVFSLCQAKGIQVTILEDDPHKSFEGELATDVLELMTVFSARLYGRRSHKNLAAVRA